MQLSIFPLVLFFFCLAGNIPTDSTDTWLSRYFLHPEKVKSFKLAEDLNEISGLAVSADGRLFGHDDERSVIYQINPKNGKIIKKFIVGKNKGLKEDFEGLCIANDKFYLVTSNGNIYQFSEGRDDENVRYEKYKTWMTSKFNVEGLCYDPSTRSLLLACKGVAGEGYKNMRAVYPFSLDSMALGLHPRFSLSIDQITQKLPQSVSQKIGEFFLLVEPKSFAPSGIERHPESGNYFILSARSRILIEITAEGHLLDVVQLDVKIHQQAEGLTFLPDNTMVISDEATEGKARITFYPPAK